MTDTPRARRRRLRSVMQRHKINCREVGEIVGRAHVTVRKWTAGMEDVPPSLLRLLILELRKE